MPILNSPTLVTTSIPRKRSVGLLSDAAETVPWSDRFAGNGVTFLPWACKDVYDVTGYPLPDCETVEAREGVLATEIPDMVSQKPFGLLEGLQRSSLCNPGDLPRIMRARLDLYGSAAVANELVTGNISTGISLAGEADVAVSGAQKLKVGLAILENALAAKLGNGRGVIHVPPGLVALMEDVAQDDTALETATGHAVVADGGYTGKVSPDTGGASAGAGEYWLYGSGPIYLSSSTALPEFGAMESFDMVHNLWDYYADQYAVVWFDPCAVVAVRVDLAA